MNQATGAAPEGLAYTLVVGPESADRAWIEATLLRGGLAVAVAEEVDVLATPDLSSPRLVILDDACDTSSRLLSLKQLQRCLPLVGVPVLVLAYDGDVDSYTSAITKGASAYLVKPVSPEELVLIAKRLCGWSGHSDRTERRRRLRRPLIMNVELQLRPSGRKLMAQMVDASGGGCCIEVGEALPRGEAVRVILHTQDASTHVALGAEVRWHRPSAAGQATGLRFTGTTALLAGKLLGFVEAEGT